LYGVIAFNMRRRVREFGVRLALGASAARVGSAVLREGALLTGTGLVGGFVLSVGVANLARGLLYGVTPTDARTHGGVFALLGVVSLVASYLPARRAARTDPVCALRQE
jgi:ABC-type antimicrobial peptide transport system permease subunit